MGSPLSDHLTAVIGRSDVAALLDMTERRVNQLSAEGWIPKPYTALTAVAGYRKFQTDEKKKSTKTAMREEIDRERAEKLRLENEATRRESFRRDETLECFALAVGMIRAILSGIAVRFTDDPAERRKLEDLIDAALNEIAAVFQREADALEAGNSNADDAAEDDALDVGEGESDLPVERGAPGAT